MGLLCCCSGTGPPCRNYVVTVAGCSAFQAGASVSYTKSGVTVSGTTGVGGTVTIPVPTAGAWTVTTSKTGFVTQTTTVTVTCSGTSASLSVFLLPAAGYSCTPDPCCPQGGSAPYTPVAYPTTIYVNDGFGAVACTGTGSASWTGCATRTASHAYDCSIPGFAAGASVPVFFAVSCGTVSINFSSCNAPTNSPPCYHPSNPGTSYAPCVRGACSPDPTCGRLLSGSDIQSFGGTVSGCPDIAFTASGTFPTPPAGFPFFQDFSNPLVPGNAPGYAYYMVYGNSISLSVSP